MSSLGAPGFPERAVRARARAGTAEVFPAADAYGAELFGSAAGGYGTDGYGNDGYGNGSYGNGSYGYGAWSPGAAPDALDALRIAPPVFMPRRLEKLIDLGREPSYEDVDLDTSIGGFTARLPLYLSAFGSTRAAAATSGWRPGGRRRGSGSRW